MIVQLTPVLPCRTNVAAVKDAGGGGGRKPVCICNTQFRIEALKQDSYKAKKHGSLDYLPPSIDNGGQKAIDEKAKAAPPPPLPPEQNYRLGKIYREVVNGDLFELTQMVPMQSTIAAAAATMADQQLQRQHPPLHAKRSLSKQQSQPQLRRTELTELVNRPDKPQAPPRVSSRQKNHETDFNVIPHTLIASGGASSLATDFDRSQQQRHSSRSAGGVERTNSSEWPQDRLHHQRHSSGPSELSLLKSDISEWLLNKRGTVKTDANKARDPMKTEVVLSKSLKEELAQLLKRPLQRQHSGPSDLSALKDDIVEWLKTQHSSAKSNAMTSASKEKATKTDSHIVPLPKKRHSLGHAEAANSDIPDWIPYPINRLSAIEREQLGVSQGSCIDISARGKSERSSSRSEHRRSEHKLRHSASEVVTPVTESNSVRQSRHHGGSKRDKYQQPPQPLQPSYMYSSIGGERSEKSGRRERSRRSHTQRSATVADMSPNVPIYAQPRKSSSAERERKNASHAKCTDPMCPLIPICTDPNCCLNDCYNTKRCSSLPRCREPHCPVDCYFDAPTLPQCIDPKCICRSSNANIIKHNSLPRFVSSHRSGPQSNLSRGGSRSSLPRLSKSNGRLVKSASAASLNSRRRRHKTVHFGENLLREVCQNRKLIEPLQKIPSEKPSLESNIQMLYNFVEGVLSAWVDEDDDHIRSGAESEPECGQMLKPIYKCRRLRMQIIRRVVGEAAQLRGTLKLGNSRYRHRHWRGTAMECNERFLRKVKIIIDSLRDFLQSTNILALNK